MLSANAFVSAVERELWPKPDDERTTEGTFFVTPAQRALVYQFVGNQAGYDETVSELVSKAEKFKQNQDNSSEWATRDMLIEIGLRVMNSPTVRSAMSLGPF